MTVENLEIETMPEQPIEEKTIQGISFKTIVWIVGCTATTIITCMSIYYGLTAQLSNLRSEMAIQRTYYEGEIKSIKQDIEYLKSKYSHYSPTNNLP